MRYTIVLSALFVGLLLAGLRTGYGQQPLPDTVPGGEQQQLARTSQSGTAGVSFDQSKTNHHFRLTQDGGILEVMANDPRDSVSVSQIRRDLPRLAAAFSWGDFTMPWQGSDQSPAGVAAMLRMKGRINFQYEDRPGGGAVSISSREPAAVEAIHQFLRGQIRDQQTGDSQDPQK
jgi:hypothetical protein